MSEPFDVAVVGSGFGGALMSMVASRLGLRTVLLERGTHPRFAIGESSSPLANLLLEELALRYDFPRLIPLTAWGPWQRAYPEIGCGLKRGFTYYFHPWDRPFPASTGRSDQLLVAASPCDEVSDTHWYRPDFDHFLVREAQDAGVDYRDQVRIDGVTPGERGGTRLAGERAGRPFDLTVRFLVDATGPAGFLARRLDLPEDPFPGFPATEALYTHFTGVRRWEDLPGSGIDGPPPYPPDAAALHHVFPGGWIWVLRFNNGITSAGAAVESRLARALGLRGDEASWGRLLEHLPSVRRHLAGVQPVHPWVHQPRVAYRSARAAGRAGPGICGPWAMLPSSAAFVDPLFSTGFPLTLLGIERLGEALASAWDTPGFGDRLDDYQAATLWEAGDTARLVGGCYTAFPTFPRFVALSMFYFAAASYSEMARRLGQRERVSRFLAGNIVPFREALLGACEAAGRPREVPDAVFSDRVARGVEPLNIAGLCRPERRNWYPIDFADLVAASHRLNLAPAEMSRWIAAQGW